MQLFGKHSKCSLDIVSFVLPVFPRHWYIAQTVHLPDKDVITLGRLFEHKNMF